MSSHTVGRLDVAVPLPSIDDSQSGSHPLSSFHKEGWLCKEGGGTYSKAIRRRFFIMSGKHVCLFYCKSPNDKNALGMVPLDGVALRLNDTRNKKRPFCFEVYHPARRTFFLYADSDAERKDWFVAINDLVSRAKNVLQGGSSSSSTAAAPSPSSSSSSSPSSSSSSSNAPIGTSKSPASSSSSSSSSLSSSPSSPSSSSSSSSSPIGGASNNSSSSSSSPMSGTANPSGSRPGSVPPNSGSPSSSSPTASTSPSPSPANTLGSARTNSTAPIVSSKLSSAVVTANGKVKGERADADNDKDEDENEDEKDTDDDDDDEADDDDENGDDSEERDTGIQMPKRQTNGLTSASSTQDSMNPKSPRLGVALPGMEEMKARNGTLTLSNAKSPASSSSTSISSAYGPSSPPDRLKTVMSLLKAYTTLSNFTAVDGGSTTNTTTNITTSPAVALSSPSPRGGTSTATLTPKDFKEGATTSQQKYTNLFRLISAYELLGADTATGTTASKSLSTSPSATRLPMYAAIPSGPMNSTTAASSSQASANGGTASSSTTSAGGDDPTKPQDSKGMQYSQLPVGIVDSFANQKASSGDMSSLSKYVSSLKRASRGISSSSQSANPSDSSVAAVAAILAHRLLDELSDEEDLRDLTEGSKRLKEAQSVLDVKAAPSLDDYSSQPWYFEDMDRRNAEQLLASKPRRTFVVRPSSRAGCLSLTHMEETGVIGHGILNRFDGTNDRFGWSIEQNPQTYPTVGDLLQSLPLKIDDYANMRPDLTGARRTPRVWKPSFKLYYSTLPVGPFSLMNCVAPMVLLDQIGAQWNGYAFSEDASSNPHFRKINPLGTVPAMADVDREYFVVVGPVTIVRYITSRSTDARIWYPDEPLIRRKLDSILEWYTVHVRSIVEVYQVAMDSGNRDEASRLLFGPILQNRKDNDKNNKMAPSSPVTSSGPNFHFQMSLVSTELSCQPPTSMASSSSASGSSSTSPSSLSVLASGSVSGSASSNHSSFSATDSLPRGFFCSLHFLQNYLLKEGKEDGPRFFVAGTPQPTIVDLLLWVDLIFAYELMSINIKKYGYLGTWFTNMEAQFSSSPWYRRYVDGLRTLALEKRFLVSSVHAPEDTPADFHRIPIHLRGAEWSAPPHWSIPKTTLVQSDAVQPTVAQASDKVESPAQPLSMSLSSAPSPSANTAVSPAASQPKQQQEQQANPTSPRPMSPRPAEPKPAPASPAGVAAALNPVSPRNEPLSPGAPQQIPKAEKPVEPIVAQPSSSVSSDQVVSILPADQDDDEDLLLLASKVAAARMASGAAGSVSAGTKSKLAQKARRLGRAANTTAGSGKMSSGSVTLVSDSAGGDASESDAASSSSSSSKNTAAAAAAASRPTTTASAASDVVSPRKSAAPSLVPSASSPGSSASNARVPQLVQHFMSSSSTGGGVAKVVSSSLASAQSTSNRNSPANPPQTEASGGGGGSSSSSTAPSVLSPRADGVNAPRPYITSTLWTDFDTSSSVEHINKLIKVLRLNSKMGDLYTERATRLLEGLENDQHQTQLIEEQISALDVAISSPSQITSSVIRLEELTEELENIRHAHSQSDISGGRSGTSGSDGDPLFALRKLYNNYINVYTNTHFMCRAFEPPSQLRVNALLSKRQQLLFYVARVSTRLSLTLRSFKDASSLLDLFEVSLANTKNVLDMVLEAHHEEPEVGTPYAVEQIATHALEECKHWRSQFKDDPSNQPGKGRVRKSSRASMAHFSTQKNLVANLAAVEQLCAECMKSADEGKIDQPPGGESFESRSGSTSSSKSPTSSSPSKAASNAFGGLNDAIKSKMNTVLAKSLDATSLAQWLLRKLFLLSSYRNNFNSSGNSNEPGSSDSLSSSNQSKETIDAVREEVLNSLKSLSSSPLPNNDDGNPVLDRLLQFCKSQMSYCTTLAEELQRLGKMVLEGMDVEKDAFQKISGFNKHIQDEITKRSSEYQTNQRDYNENMQKRLKRKEEHAAEVASAEASAAEHAAAVAAAVSAGSPKTNSSDASKKGIMDCSSSVCDVEAQLVFNEAQRIHLNLISAALADDLGACQRICQEADGTIASLMARLESPGVSEVESFAPASACVEQLAQTLRLLSEAVARASEGLGWSNSVGDALQSLLEPLKNAESSSIDELWGKCVSLREVHARHFEYHQNWGTGLSEHTLASIQTMKNLESDLISQVFPSVTTATQMTEESEPASESGENRED